MGSEVHVHVDVGVGTVNTVQVGRSWSWSWMHACSLIGDNGDAAVHASMTMTNRRTLTTLTQIDAMLHGGSF